jgi:hypothetical protein
VIDFFGTFFDPFFGTFFETTEAAESPVWTITFSGNDRTSGELSATTTTAPLTVTTATSELAVSELAIA